MTVKERERKRKIKRKEEREGRGGAAEHNGMVGKGAKVTFEDAIDSLPPGNKLCVRWATLGLRGKLNDPQKPHSRRAQGSAQTQGHKA